MAGEWRLTRLGDHVSIKGGLSYRGADVDQGDALLVGMGCVSHIERFLVKGARRYGGHFSESHRLRPRDLVIATRQQSDELPILGYPAMIPAALEDRDVVVATNLYKITNSSELDNGFLYWLLRGKEYRERILQCSKGTTVRMITKDAIEDFEFLCPPPRERDAIASILDSFEDKIDLNRRMNETLEAMAQALFKSWFEDFEPVRAKTEGRDPGLPKSIADVFPSRLVNSELGPIPEGWQVGTLGDVLCQRVARCVVSDETVAQPYVPIECISPRSLFLNSSKLGKEAQSSLTRFYRDDLLFGAMRPYFHKVCIAPFDGTTRTTAFVLYPRRADDYAFATLLLHHPQTIDFATRHSTGSTIPYAIWAGSMETMPVILPSSPARAAFNDAIRPMLARIPQSYFESQTLATLRDTLLPKLISGKLRVKNAERPMVANTT